MDLNPVAFEPSMFIPFIPYTERIEQLNTYGDAPCTVSVSTVTVAAEVLPGIRVSGGFGNVYVNTVLSLLLTPVTVADIL